MTINVFVGFDQLEAIAYLVFGQSVLEKTTSLINFTPLAHQNLNFLRIMMMEVISLFILDSLLLF